MSECQRCIQCLPEGCILSMPFNLGSFRIKIASSFQLTIFDYVVLITIILIIILTLNTIKFILLAHSIFFLKIFLGEFTNLSLSLEMVEIYSLLIVTILNFIFCVYLSMTGLTIVDFNKYVIMIFRCITLLSGHLLYNLIDTTHHTLSSILLLTLTGGATLTLTPFILFFHYYVLFSWWDMLISIGVFPLATRYCCRNHLYFVELFAGWAVSPTRL